MQSTASSAGYATGNMVVGVVPALLLLSISPAQPHGVPLEWWKLALWIPTLAALGVVLAIPLRGPLLEKEKLPFPSAIAAAALLEGLYERGREATAKAWALVAGFAVSSVWMVGRHVASAPAVVRCFDWLSAGQWQSRALVAGDRGLVLDLGLALVGAGAFVGLRVASWMVVGGIATAFVLGPLGLDAPFPAGPSGFVIESPELAWRDLGVWAGSALLVVHGLVGLLARWRSGLLALRAWGGGGAEDPHDLRSRALPRSWFWSGFVLTGGGAILLGRLLFAIPAWLGVVAVLLSVLFAGIAARVTGETDVTPGAPLGKLTQLIVGTAAPAQPSTSLMAAAMTHASAIACADLLSDWQTGRLLGADPRRQWIAQSIGIFAGTAGSVIAYSLLVPDASALVGARPAFAAPGAHQFKAIAEVLRGGLSHLPLLAQHVAVIGAIVGAVLALFEAFVPRERRALLPSATGFGLGLLLPVAVSLSLWMGAAIAALFV